MKKLLILMVFSGLVACGDTDKDDPCADLERRWEADLVKFQGMLENEAESRDRGLDQAGSNVAQMTSIWNSYNQRSGEIRSTFNEMYADYYKDCNPSAERLQ